MLLYMQGIVKCCVFTLVNMPLVTVWAGKYLSVYVALRQFARNLVSWYLCLCAWYLQALV